MKTRSQLSAIFLILVVISCSKGFAQAIPEDSDMEMIKTRYTILDSDSRSFRSFFGSKSGQIRFDLVELKNLMNDSTLLGVEVKIQTSELEQLSTSIAFANIGSLWGLSSGATYRNIRNNGYILLDQHDLDTIITFLNDIIGAAGRAQENFTLYKISIRGEFQMGMVYDDETAEPSKWGFIFSAGDSVYRLNYQDGILLMKSLSKFHRYIKENQPDYGGQPIAGD